MFFGFDLKEIFLFPVKDAEARKHFLIGCLVSLAALVIPVVPYLFLLGYAMIIARQVFNNESPRMVAWDNWSELFKDGAKVFGIRMIYALPMIILFAPLFLGSFAMPFMMDGSNGSEVSPFFLVFMVIFAGSMCLLIPLSIAIAVIVPAAELHAIDKNDFSAGFRIREWWAIFRANMGGFLAAFGIYYAASIVMGLVFQLLMVTLVLACLLPILIPALTTYMALIMYVTIAQAYRDGKAKLALTELAPAQ